MINPKSWQISADPVEELRNEIKDISKIKPLFLNKKPSSWLYDSKNLLRIYLRCRKNNFMPNQLCNLMNKWAAILLETLPYYVSHEEIPKNSFGFLDTSWHASILWIKAVLIEILGMTPELFYGSKIKTFYRTDLKLNWACCIYHVKEPRVFNYKMLLDNGLEIKTNYIGERTYKKLLGKITRSIKRMSNIKYKKKLQREIEEYNANRKPSGRLGGRANL